MADDPMPASAAAPSVAVAPTSSATARAKLAPIRFEDLFDADLLEGVQRLRIVARRVAPGGRFAEQRSRDLGHGIEFRDYRPYTPGDDMRGIDWNIYRRLGRVFLRQFEELEDLPMYLLPDVSASLFVESPPLRARACLQATLACAAIALGQHDTVGVFPFHERLDVAVRPTAGKHRVHSLARALASIAPGTRTDLVGALRTFGAQRLREGLVVIVSDFFDPAGIDAVLAALDRLRHRLLLVQLVRASDRSPVMTGDVRLVDSESGDAQNVSITPQVLTRYREAYDRFASALTSFAERRGAGLARLDVDQPIVGQLAGLFEGGALRT